MPSREPLFVGLGATGTPARELAALLLGDAIAGCGEEPAVTAMRGTFRLGVPAPLLSLSLAFAASFVVFDSDSPLKAHATS